MERVDRALGLLLRPLVAGGGVETLTAFDLGALVRVPSGSGHAEVLRIEWDGYEE